MEKVNDDAETPIAGAHGSSRLPSVSVESYNLELRDGEDFVGDRASNRAFRAIIEDWREQLRKVGQDPLGDKPTSELSKKKLDKVLLEGEPEAAGVVQSAIEQFASELTAVIERFLKVKDWRDIQRIVVGGGLRASRIGELVIGRASVALKGAGHAIDVRPIHHDPDEAGLMGAAHLVPSWILEGYDAILAVDIGGSNIRSGLLTLNSKKGVSLPETAVHDFELWCHADETKKPTRDEAVDRIHQMLRRLTKRAGEGRLEARAFRRHGVSGCHRTRRTD